MVMLEAQALHTKCIVSSTIDGASVLFRDAVVKIDIKEPASVWADAILHFNKYNKEEPELKAEHYSLGSVIGMVDEIYS